MEGDGLGEANLMPLARSLRIRANLLLKRSTPPRRGRLRSTQ